MYKIFKKTIIKLHVVFLALFILAACSNFSTTPNRMWDKEIPQQEQEGVNQPLNNNQEDVNGQDQNNVPIVPVLPIRRNCCFSTFKSIILPLAVVVAGYFLGQNNAHQHIGSYFNSDTLTNGFFCKEISPNEEFNTISIREDDESKGIIVTGGVSRGGHFSVYAIIKPTIISDKLKFTVQWFREDGEKFGDKPYGPSPNKKVLRRRAKNDNFFFIKDLPSSCISSPTVYRINVSRPGSGSPWNIVKIRFTAVKKRGWKDDLIIDFMWIDKELIYSKYSSARYKYVVQS